MRSTLFACALALVASACGRAEPPKERKLEADSLVELDLSEAPNERAPALLGDGPPTHLDAIVRVHKLLDDPRTRGLFVRLGSMAGRFADVDDWAQAFDAYRASKKPVHCQFDEIDNAGYALAAHCDRLSMTPAGLLNLVGLAAQVVHGRALLEQVGVRAELVQMGKYKGAAEPFTRDTPSPELRQSLDQLLDDLEATFRGHLRTRLKDESALKALLDAGPYTSETARSAGLIDAVAYDDEARANAKQASNARVVHRPFEPKDAKKLSLTDLLTALTGQHERGYEGQAHLGVALLTGDIRDGRETGGMSGVTSDPFVKALRRWGDDGDVRAVVLRIESPGGSALASDRMWHAVQRVAKRKPVIVSLGDMAASGGYYVASAGSTIVAAPGSILGSIGVVGGKMVIEGLANRVGVHVTSLPRSANATWLSPFASFSPGERSAFERMLESTYGRFLERVAQGRKQDVRALVPAAEGRVMGGQRGKELGLVDEVGGLARALTIARERGKLPASAPIEVWPRADEPLEALGQLIGAEAAQSGLAREIEALPLELLSAGSLVRGLVEAREPVLTALPFALYVH